MGNEIIIAILVILFYIALKETVKHFKGQGGCCGGLSYKAKRKKLEGTIVSKCNISIEGMHCENCSNRIENAINKLDGVSCKVNLRKKEAVISSTHEIDRGEIADLITGLGYKIIG